MSLSEIERCVDGEASEVRSEVISFLCGHPNIGMSIDHGHLVGFPVIVVVTAMCISKTRVAPECYAVVA
jgi:hypothetical protein